jgi:hypothetical protein
MERVPDSTFDYSDVIGQTRFLWCKNAIAMTVINANCEVRVRVCTFTTSSCTKRGRRPGIAEPQCWTIFLGN